MARDFRWAGLVVTVLTTMFIVLVEISSLAVGFPDEAGETWPLTSADMDQWRSALLPGVGSAWLNLLQLFVVIDVLFVVAYVGAAYLLKRRVDTTSCTVFFWGVVLVGVADLAENLLMLCAGFNRADGDISESVVDTLKAATIAKWVVLGLVVVFVLFLAWRGRVVVRQYAEAVWIQRYSLFAFLPIALLACVPLRSVFDQLPDVQRRWLGGEDEWDAPIAAVFLLLLSVGVFLIGRMRSDAAWRRADRPGEWPWYDPPADDAPPAPPEALGPARLHNLWLWLVGPAVMLVIAASVALFADGDNIALKRLACFVGVPLVLVIVSVVIRYVWTPDLGDVPTRPSAPTWQQVMVVGDIVAVAALSVGGVGLVRAVSAPVALELADPSTVDLSGWAFLAWFTAGLFLLALPWMLSQSALIKVSDWASATSPSLRQDIARSAVPGEAVAGTLVRWVLIGLFAAFFLLLCIFPTEVSGWLGVIASVNLALLSLVAIVGVTVAYAQERQPPEVFQVGPLRRKATPVVPVAILALVLANLVGSPTDVHRVDRPEGMPQRPSLSEAFASWIASDGACRGSVRVRGRSYDTQPMLLIAAEGGGLRATYWAASALAEIAGFGEDGCGAHNALFSGGASGGALGVTIARFADDPVAAADAIAGPDALGTAAVSLVTRDFLASLTGVGFSSPSEWNQRGPANRATLMEHVWQDAWADDQDLESLAEASFVPPLSESAPDAVTGHLILTATDVLDGCRALISQIDLGRARSGPSLGTDDDPPGCGLSNAGANAYDLLSAFGRSQAGTGKSCMGNPYAVTAGLIASRFPYVTPSAVVAECRRLATTPLSDGGYSDNSALSTILDLGPKWVELVRHHNDRVLRGRLAEPLVLPMVVYLDNGPGTDYVLAPREDPPFESLVPLISITRAKGRQPNASGYLKQLRPMLEDSLCSKIVAPCDDLKGLDLGQTYVAHQAVEPALAEPLGWVLSDISRGNLSQDIESSLTPCSAVGDRDPACRAGHGTLGDLRDALASSNSPSR